MNKCKIISPIITRRKTSKKLFFMCILSHTKAPHSYISVCFLPYCFHCLLFLHIHYHLIRLLPCSKTHNEPVPKISCEKAASEMGQIAINGWRRGQLYKLKAVDRSQQNTNFLFWLCVTCWLAAPLSSCVMNMLLPRASTRSTLFLKLFISTSSHLVFSAFIFQPCAERCLVRLLSSERKSWCKNCTHFILWRKIFRYSNSYEIKWIYFFRFCNLENFFLIIFRSQRSINFYGCECFGCLVSLCD